MKKHVTGAAVAVLMAGVTVTAPVGVPPANAADGEQSVLVEDFAYPGADAILAEHGLKVFKGDGHIEFVTSRHYEDGSCEPGQIQVERMFDVDPWGIYYCFRTSGAQGYLTLEVPSTFLIRGGDTPVTATAELPGGAEQTYQVPPNTSVAVDPGTGAEMPQAVLVELRFASSGTPGGGAATDPVAASTVKLDVGGQRACSGALVHRWWVVTARSCFTGTVDGDLAGGAPSLATTVTVGRPDLSASGGHVVTVDRLVPHAGRDLVLARLAAPVNDVAPVPVATSAPVVGDTLTVAGYGRTGTEWALDTVHTSAFTVAGVGTSTLALQASSTGLLCKGDGGGPALRPVTGGGVELVAIHHTGGQGACFAETSTSTDATETRVDDLHAWITQTAVEPFKHVMGADWSGDGAADVLAVDSAGLLWYYPHNGNALSPRVQIGSGWSGFKHVTAGDWSGDGRADVLGVDPNGYLRYYEHVGSGFAAPVQIGPGWGTFAFVSSADWNGDGKADVLGVDADARLRYYARSGTGLAGAVFLEGFPQLS